MSLKNAWLSSSIFYLAGKGPNSSFRYTTLKCQGYKNSPYLII